MYENRRGRSEMEKEITREKIYRKRYEGWINLLMKCRLVLIDILTDILILLLGIEKSSKATWVG